MSRTSIRPFVFTSNQIPSRIEVLVRTGTMLPFQKPYKSEKGLQDISSRDGNIRPILLAPLLLQQAPDLQQFEPTTSIHEEEQKKDVVEETNPAKDWAEGLNSLGKGTVKLSQGVVQIKEVKKVEWKDLRNIVLFRFHCGMISWVVRVNGSCNANYTCWN